MKIVVPGPRIDWKAERERVDLAAVATRYLGPAPGRRGERGRRLWWPCPFHPDQNPSFCIDPGKPWWSCYGCGQSGDAATLVMKLDGVGFPEALRKLTGDPAPAGGRPGARPAGHGKPPGRPQERPGPAPATGPSGLPEAAALALVEAAEARLWSAEGAAALAYLEGGPRPDAPAFLEGRCLSRETIRAARLGVTPWVSLPKSDGGTFRACGVVIPWFAGGRLALVKIRQPDDRRPKYVEAFRDPARATVYPNPEAVLPGRPLVVTEGEFDCLILAQEINGLAAVVTLGSASSRPDGRSLSLMLRAPTWYVATDADPAGDRAADGWPPRARRVRPPGRYKDWTEVRQGHAPLARWWRDVLGGVENPPLFTWEELSAKRWGPAPDDAPGFGTDNPGRRPSLETLARALDPGDDPEAVAERLAVRDENGPGPGPVG